MTNVPGNEPEICTRCGGPIGPHAFTIGTDDGQRHEFCPQPPPSREPQEIAELLADTLRVLRTRDNVEITEEQIVDRAANGAQALLGAYEVRRRGDSPMLLPVGADVVRVDRHPQDAETDTEVARLTILEPRASVALTASEAKAIAAGLTTPKGAR